MQEIEQEFDVEISEDSVVIRTLRLIDPEVVTILGECKNLEEVESLTKQALKIGLIITRNGKTVQNIDYIEKNFLQFNHTMDNNFTTLEQNMTELFGPKGSVIALFDMANKKGLTAKLLDEINRQLQDLLSVTSDKTAFGMLRRDLQQNFAQLNAVVNQLVGKKSEFEKGSQKGVKFEEELYEFFSIQARITGDNIEKTGSIARGRDKKGDLVVTLYEPGLADELSIVIEAKDTCSINIEGPTGLLKQVEQGMENRNADFGIGVVKNLDSLPKSNGPLRYYPDKNIIICGYGDDGLPLELAFIFARSILIQRVSQNLEKEAIDLKTVERVFNDINSKLKVIRNIKKNMTEIEKLTNATRYELDDLGGEIETLVTEGLQTLQENSQEY